MTMVTQAIAIRGIAPVAATAASVAPFGRLLTPAMTGALALPGAPARVALRQLGQRPLLVRALARRPGVTLCLASARGAAWFACLAPAAAVPAPDDVACLRIPALHALALEPGTWLAGPFFDGDEHDFLHVEAGPEDGPEETARLDRAFRVTLAITP